MSFNRQQNVDLAADLNRSNVRQRSQAGRSLSYIESWHAIAEANRIFGFDGWSSETVDIRMVSERERQIGQPPRVTQGWGVTYVCRLRIAVYAGERGWIAREGVGSGHGIDRDLGQAHESAIKEAESDARKRALMTFGNQFGLALYDKEQRNVSDGEEAAPTPPKPPTTSQKAVATVKPPAAPVDEIPHTQPNHAQQAAAQAEAVTTAARQDGAATATVAKMAAQAAAPAARWQDRERAKTRSRIDPQVSASVLSGVLSDLADVSTEDELKDWTGRRQRENTRAKLIDGHAASMDEAFKRKKLLIAPPVKAGVAPVSHDPETGELVEGAP